MTRIGCELVLEEGRVDRMYKSHSSSRPKWMRGCSDEVKTSSAGVKYIRSIGWELKDGNRMFTTCPKFTKVTVKWRR